MIEKTTRKILSSIGTANVSRGARMVGSCAHVASLLWFTGVQRHENDVSSQIMPHNILDCETSSVMDFSSASDEYDSSSH